MAFDHQFGITVAVQILNVDLTSADGETREIYVAFKANTIDSPAPHEHDREDF